MHPEEAKKTGERAGRQVLGGTAEDSGFDQFGEKEAEGCPHGSAAS